MGKKTTSTIMEEYLKELINQAIEEKSISLREEDAKKIIQAMIPELDELISKRVKKHFHTIFSYLKNTYETEEKI